MTTGSASASDFVRAAMEREPSRDRLAEQFIEPAARRLGDMWTVDACTDTDLFEGPWRLQSLFRSFPTPARSENVAPLSVLVAPLPGESSQLNVTLAAESIWQAGWSPRVHFPPAMASLLRHFASESHNRILW